MSVNDLLKNHLLTAQARTRRWGDLLFPQYEGAWVEVPRQVMWELRRQAIERLQAVGEDQASASVEVLEHWRFIADGGVPFGLRVTGFDTESTPPR